MSKTVAKCWPGDKMRTVAKCWEFMSGSSSKVYETLLYMDGSTSCNCPGWTRRTDARGNRSCKHTRMVDMDVADRRCVAKTDYREDVRPFGQAYPGTPKEERHAKDVQTVMDMLSSIPKRKITL